MMTFETFLKYLEPGFGVSGISPSTPLLSTAVTLSGIRFQTLNFFSTWTASENVEESG